MTYAMSGALQTALFQELAADATLQSLLGSHVYDEMPSGEVSDLFVVIGDERVRDWSTMTEAGADHRLTVSVVSDQEGYLAAKQAAAAVSNALSSSTFSFAEGRVVLCRFEGARARRVRSGQRRRIDLNFRVIVEET